METHSSSDRLRACKTLPPPLPAIEGWPEWKPALTELEHPDALIRDSLSALSWAEATSVNLVRREDVSMLNHLDWKGLDVWIREVFGPHLPELGADEGFLLRAQVSALYPGASARGNWDALFDSPAQIIARSLLQENIRLLLFYATVFASHGIDDELARLRPTLDLCRRGFLPLGLNAERRIYLVTG